MQIPSNGFLGMDLANYYGEGIFFNLMLDYNVQKEEKWVKFKKLDCLLVEVWELSNCLRMYSSRR